MEDGSIYSHFGNASQENINSIIPEIIKGKKLVHLDNNDEVISTFDLTGSFEAVEKLVECLKNL